MWRYFGSSQGGRLGLALSTQLTPSSGFRAWWPWPRTASWRLWPRRFSISPPSMICGKKKAGSVSRTTCTTCPLVFGAKSTETFWPPARRRWRSRAFARTAPDSPGCSITVGSPSWTPKSSTSSSGGCSSTRSKRGPSRTGRCSTWSVWRIISAASKRTCRPSTATDTSSYFLTTSFETTRRSSRWRWVSRSFRPTIRPTCPDLCDSRVWLCEAQNTSSGSRSRRSSSCSDRSRPLWKVSSLFYWCQLYCKLAKTKTFELQLPLCCQMRFTIHLAQRWHVCFSPSGPGLIFGILESVLRCYWDLSASTVRESEQWLENVDRTYLVWRVSTVFCQLPRLTNLRSSPCLTRPEPSLSPTN